MIPRDKAIIRSLEKFRVLTRDDIAALHFAHCKDPIREVNTVMRRLVDRKEVEVSKERRQYMYFPLEGIKKNSTKIPHFLAIGEFYRTMLKYGPHVQDEVEPKLGEKDSGFPEPDLFTIWFNQPLFIEVQRNYYTPGQWEAKIQRYETYYQSGEWKKLSWQPPKKYFPFVWFAGKVKDISGVSFTVISGEVEEIVKSMGK
jgi:hypothetical protein